MKFFPLLALASSVCISISHAAPRTSITYHIAAESNDAGGLRGTSASYTNDGSAGGITGISTDIAPTEIDKAGYLAQLADPVNLGITAPAGTVPEGGTLQLAATLVLDDATHVILSPTSVMWGVASAPITSVSNSGLLTAGTVYQDTGTTQQGSYAGFTDSISLTVIDTLPDNYGAYAEDGLPDNWQVLYFGIGSLNAAPAADPDHDGYDNLFEYNAYLIPSDPLSTFSITVVSVPGGGHEVTFSPRQTGSTYDLQGSSDLIHWAPVLGTITDSGLIRTISDPLGNLPCRFYRIGVSRP